MDRDDDGPVTRRSDDFRPAHKILVGEAISGKYRIESMLGAGGMGTVFRAHHLQLDRRVALKVMHTDLLADESAARRFALEARATAALKSPHAVRVLDIDRLPSGAPFIVMELLEGKNLATLVEERGPLTLDRAVHYLLQAAEAIAEAHAHGIIHRDLKPQNMILTSDGIVKVLDFGLAKALRPPSGAAPDSSLTATNVLVGSPSYMSPEQIWSGRSVDERTDIWGLGVTLYHLLTGGPPFAASDMRALASRIGSEEPRRVAERRADVSPTVDAVIVRCMRKNPAERYQTIAAFQGALLHLRVELQQGGARVSPRETATVPMGGTMPATTRPERSPAALHPDNAATLVTAPVSGHRPDDDEPTEISTTLPEVSGLGATRKR
ncbi:MAG TPA: serine/threonine-protein kinase [Labilithrix sp.]|nr:serine/threonine-protein kinase [Labilithrix sp.]